MPGNGQRKMSVMAVGLLFPLQLFGFVLNLSTNPLQSVAVIALVYLEYIILRNTSVSSIIPCSTEQNGE